MIFSIKICINYLNSLLVENKIEAGVRPDPRKTKSDSRIAIKFDVTELLLEFFLAELRLELAIELR